MKRGLFLYILTFSLVALSLLLISVSFAAVPDADFDGVPNENDKCPNSQTTTVDQFGCSCEQKNCASDNNVCTDDCSVINGIPACAYTNNRNSCPGGYCDGGRCNQIAATSVRKKITSPTGYPKGCKNPSGGDYCGGKSEISDCYCDDLCESYGDCCSDYKDVCPPPQLQKENVLCVFQGSNTYEKCYPSYPNVGCSGIGMCEATVYGKKGELVEWESSCGGYATTVIDGIDEKAVFSCVPKEIEVKEPDSFTLVEGQSAMVVNYKDMRITLNKMTETAENDKIAAITVSAKVYNFSQDYKIRQKETIDVLGLKIMPDGFSIDELGNQYWWFWITSSKCTDSDMGLYNYGGYMIWIHPTTGQINIDYDECTTVNDKNNSKSYVSKEGKYLIENYCQFGHYGGGAFLVYECPNGCKDGACISDKTQICTDTDGSPDYNDPILLAHPHHRPNVSFTPQNYPDLFVKGETQDSNGQIIDDVCSHPFHLFEEFCSKDGLSWTMGVVCPNGCKDGACINVPIQPPKLTISPTDFLQGETILGAITNAQPNSNIFVTCHADNAPCTDPSNVEGITDAKGNFQKSYSTTGWTPGSYVVSVTIGGVYSNKVEFIVRPNTKCPTAFSGLSPSGIVKPTGDPAYVILSWPSVSGATHYNVRLDDGATLRYDDPRFETCQNSPHYYCENGIASTSITNVPVKPGRTYSFWVDPVIPGCGYFNGNTVFSVTNIEKTPKGEVISLSSGTNIIKRGDPVRVRLYDAPINSQVYITVRDFNTGQMIFDNYPFGKTNDNGILEIKASGQDTLGWAAITYVGYATIQDAVSGDYVTSEKVIFIVEK